MTAPRMMAAALTATIVLVPAAASAAGKPKFTPGSAGAGDPYFKTMGNGGYDVASYGIRLAYDPAGKAISAVTKISARATKNLSRFNLDLRGLTVTGVKVDGKSAKWTRKGFQELVITPPKGIPAGRKFAVTVAYRGVPKPISDDRLGTSGWIPTDDGAVALNQPFGSASWFPVNDTPRDKAVYAFTLVVPKGLTALANGDFLGRKAVKGGKWAYRWKMNQPMASELSTVAIGKYQVRLTRKKGTRMQSVTAFDVALKPKAGQLAAYEKKTRDIVRWQSSLFGPYPFSVVGGIVDRIDVGYSLETQGIPVHDWSLTGVNPPDDLLVHELAHQWFGDSVSPSRWSDIWLNEGFATYAEWLWTEKNRGTTAEQHFQRAYSAGPDADVWKGVLANPGRDHIFDTLVYQRGAMAVHALRRELGDAVFFRLIRSWAQVNRNKNVTTQNFHAFAEKFSGRQLDALFAKWVYKAGKPAKP